MSHVSYEAATGVLGVLGFYVAVLGNLHRLFGSQELWLENSAWPPCMFGLAVLLSDVDGQRPRREEM